MRRIWGNSDFQMANTIRVWYFWTLDGLLLVSKGRKQFRISDRRAKEGHKAKLVTFKTRIELHKVRLDRTEYTAEVHTVINRGQKSDL